MAAGDTAQASVGLHLLAGSIGGFGNVDGAGADARFNFPQGMATDSAGNVYVADNNAIRKITPTGVVTTLAGKTGESGLIDGSGLNARFDQPTALAVDRSDNLFVADSQNQLIRKISPDGIVTTFAGTPGSYNSSDGVGTTARFLYPSGLAMDKVGNLFVADRTTIRKITPMGVVTTVAGKVGEEGSIDGAIADARFISLSGLTIDSLGNLYVTDRGDIYTPVLGKAAVRKITPSGIVTTLPGIVGSTGISFTGTPYGLAVDSADNVYVADSAYNSIRKITPSGVMTTLAGLDRFEYSNVSADGVGSDARFSSPYGITTDTLGNIYVADTYNNTIRKITPAGSVSTFAGTALVVGAIASGRMATLFAEPIGLAVDNVGNAYVADAFNHTVFKITPAGTVSDLTGGDDTSGLVDSTGAPARFKSPRGVAADNAGNVYVSDLAAPYFVNVGVRKISPDGVVSTITDGACYAGGAESGYFYPFGLATDSVGNIYLAAGSILQITQTGIVTTFSTASSLSELSRYRVATDRVGNIYTVNGNAIQKITPAGVRTTLAGTWFAGSADGVGPNAQFNSPSGLATDTAGNVYVADTGNHTIRKITPAGGVTTIIGVPGQQGNIMGSLPGSLSSPIGVSVDANGTIYILTPNAVVKAVLP